MPDRYIRDELLSSARFWSVSSQAQVLFLACMLLADDAARLSAAPLALRLRGMAGTVDDARLGELLRELTHADLVRTYSVAGRGDFLFIPRFRQRKRYVAGSKHPPPPKEISDIDDKSQTQVGPKPDSSQTTVRPKSDSSLRAGARGVGVGVGVPISPPSPSLPPPPPAKTAKPAGGKHPKVNGSPGWWKTDAGVMAHAVELGVAPLPGETYAALKTRLFALTKRPP
jgi:hypothetical protein